MSIDRFEGLVDGIECLSLNDRGRVEVVDWYMIFIRKCLLGCNYTASVLITSFGGSIGRVWVVHRRILVSRVPISGGVVMVTRFVF